MTTPMTAIVKKKSEKEYCSQTLNAINATNENQIPLDTDVLRSIRST